MWAKVAFDRLLIGIANTQKADCERLVLNTIKPDKFVVVVVGEAEKFKSELEKIVPVTVVNKSNFPLPIGVVVNRQTSPY